MLYFKNLAIVAVVILSIGWINDTTTTVYFNNQPTSRSAMAGAAFGEGLNRGIQQALAQRQQQQQLEEEVAYLVMLKELEHQQRMQEIEEQKRLEEIARQQQYFRDLEYQRQLKIREEQELKIKEQRLKLEAEREWQTKKNYLLIGSFLVALLLLLSIYVFRKFQKNYSNS